MQKTKMLTILDQSDFAEKNNQAKIGTTKSILQPFNSLDSFKDYLFSFYKIKSLVFWYIFIKRKDVDFESNTCIYYLYIMLITILYWLLLSIFFKKLTF
jgi:hypothetical protein